MSARRLEEILEECLSAYLDGRRSIDESLSLYPAYRAELEPLLRTATSINYAVSSFSPPQHVQQRGLHRFLSDARVRRDLKTLQVEGVRRGRFAVAWQRYRLGFAGAAMAVAVLVAALGGASIISQGGGGDSVTQVTTDAPTPAVVIALQQQVDTLRTKKASQTVTADDIDKLLAAAAALENTPDSEIDTVRASIAQALNDANDIVTEIIAAQDPTLTQPAQNTQDKIRDVAANIGVTVGVPTPVVTGTPVAVTASPTEAATPTQAPTVAPTPTAAPTEAPTPTLPPAPSDSPPPRAPAGFAP